MIASLNWSMLWSLLSMLTTQQNQRSYACKASRIATTFASSNDLSFWAKYSTISFIFCCEIVLGSREAFKILKHLMSVDDRAPELNVTASAQNWVQSAESFHSPNLYLRSSHYWNSYWMISVAWDSAKPACSQAFRASSIVTKLDPELDKLNYRI